MSGAEMITEEEYRQEVLRTFSGDIHDIATVLNIGALGLAGETGEVVDLIKKRLFHGHEINQEKLLEELGDIFWYYTLILEAMGFTFQEVMHRNAKKLRHRYPNGFESECSIKRDINSQVW